MIKLGENVPILTNIVRNKYYSCELSRHLEEVNDQNLLVVVDVIFVFIFAFFLVIESTIPKIVDDHLNERDNHVIAQVVIECDDSEPLGNPEES